MNKIIILMKHDDSSFLENRKVMLRGRNIETGLKGRIKKKRVYFNVLEEETSLS